MNILVTGGLGYIGSHTVVALLNEGHKVTVIDDLSNSDEKVCDYIVQLTNKEFDFYHVSFQDFVSYDEFDCIIHFAAYKSVPESISNPYIYYRNNVEGVANMSDCPNIIFSSSCAVYGNAISPIKEMSQLCPTSPYGNTKMIGEQILKDCGTNVIALRYFNPVGNLKDLPTSNDGLYHNLVNNTGTINVFGTDYPTRDGTCIRDYIHVCDVADAHVLAIKALSKGFQAINIGRGKGVTVNEFISEYEQAKGVKVNRIHCDRREGDVVEAYADCTKAEKILGFKAKRNLFI